MLRILRRPEVENRTGLSVSTLYLEIQKGAFPKPVPLGKMSVGWVESEVQAWLEARVADRDAGKKVVPLWRQRKPSNDPWPTK